MTFEQNLAHALRSLFGGYSSGMADARRVILEMGIDRAAKHAFSNRRWLVQRMTFT